MSVINPEADVWQHVKVLRSLDPLLAIIELPSRYRYLIFAVTGRCDMFQSAVMGDCWLSLGTKDLSIGVLLLDVGNRLQMSCRNRLSQCEEE